LIAYFIDNISAKKYQNPFVCVKVIASQRWGFFETRCRFTVRGLQQRRPPVHYTVGIPHNKVALFLKTHNEY